MRCVLPLQLSDAMPHRDAVLINQGMPSGEELPERIRALLDKAMEHYVRLVRPRGVVEELSADEFAAIYPGEGQNDPDTPVAQIFRQAERLALFAVTLGEPVSREIERLMRVNEPALGYMLDSVASEGAEGLSRSAAAAFEREQRAAGSTARVLGYSPGYCGWHVSGQGRLFARLMPDDIGISLNDSYLMQPLKSVSGVLLAAQLPVHDFPNDYDFCDVCATHTCKERIAAIAAEEV